jgi:hypothetical protein
VGYLILFGVLLLLFVALPSGGSYAAGRKESAQAQRDLELVNRGVTPMQRLQHGVPALVCGKAWPGGNGLPGEGVLTCPLTHRKVIGYDIEVWKVSRGRSSSMVGLVFRATEQSPFWLDDGSGRAVWVLPDGARLLRRRVFYVRTVRPIMRNEPIERRDMTPDVEQWVRATRPGERLGENFSVSYRTIELDQPSCVLGTPSWNGSAMVMAGGSDLLTSDLSPRELEENLRKRARSGLVTKTIALGSLLLGAGMLVTGVVGLLV